MFAFLKKRPTQRMRQLLQLAQFAAVSQFTHEHEHEAYGKTLVPRAAAATNYVFANSLIPADDSAEASRIAKQDAEAWLSRNRAIRQLIVQSLRVASAIGWAQSGTRSDIAQSLLEQFGKEFFGTPREDAYRALLREVIESLPPSDVREQLLSRV